MEGAAVKIADGRHHLVDCSGEEVCLGVLQTAGVDLVDADSRRQATFHEGIMRLPGR